VVGAGNIGSKVALGLADTGRHVLVVRRRLAQAERLAAGLNLALPKHSRGSIEPTCLSDADWASVGLVLGVTVGVPVITGAMVRQLPEKAVVVDIGIGTLAPDAIATALQRDLTVFRLDIWAGLLGAAVTAIETEHFFREIAGRRHVATSDGPRVLVAGGVIGAAGDLVVDNITTPTRVIGTADGRGGIADRYPGLSVADLSPGRPSE